MREQKNKKKRIINTVLSVCLIAALIITGIYALLQASDTRTNTYSYGNVDAILYEDDWYDHNTNALIGDEDGNGVKDIAEYVACYEKIDKTPYIVNTGINDAYAFVAVGIPTIDYTYIYGTESEVKASYGMSVGIKINAYVVQDGLVDDVADENKLQTLWGYCINGDTVKNIPIGRRSNKGLESVSICDINEDWELVDVIKATKEVAKDRNGNIILGANGEQLEFTYNYYVYGHKNLLLGEKSYKDKYGAKPNLEVEPDAEETDIALQYWNSYNEDIRTTPVFTKFEINNLGVKKWACSNSRAYDNYYNQYTAGSSSGSGRWYSFNDSKKQTTFVQFKESELLKLENSWHNPNADKNEAPTITSEPIDIGNAKLYFVFHPITDIDPFKGTAFTENIVTKAWIEAVIELADGTKFTSSKEQQTKKMSTSSNSGMYWKNFILMTRSTSVSGGGNYTGNNDCDHQVIEEFGNHPDRVYKCSNICFGNISSATANGYAPHVAIVSYDNNDTLMRGTIFVFDTLEYNGVKYSLTPSIGGGNTPLQQVKFKGYEITPVFEGTYKDWLETCINTGEFVGDCPWLR